MNAPICFIDTETTSLAPWREPWEIAMIRRDDQGQREVSFFISPIDLEMADPMSLKFARFYERHPDFDGPKAEQIGYGYPFDKDGLGRSDERLTEHQPMKIAPADAAGLIHRWTRGAHIVGAVPNFDMDMLHRDLLRYKLTPAWHYHLIDVENLAVGWLRHFEEGNMAELRKIDPAIKFAPSKTELPWKSDDLSRACGVEPPSDEERHTALGDARWCQRWYDKIMGVAT